MKKAFIIFLCFTQHIGKCQIDEKYLYNYSLQNLVLCQTTFQRPDSSYFAAVTCGIIIKGQYLLTCYHDNFAPGNKLIRRSAAYNFRERDGKLFYDTLHLLDKFKLTPDQYDFSKHIFKPQDHGTDVYVFKLQRPVPEIKYSFATNPPNQRDTLYACGGFWDSKAQLITRQCTNNGAVFRYVEYPTSPFWFLVSIGDIIYGYSGSALYNIRGEIVGMTLFGWDDKPTEMIENYYKNKIFDGSTYKVINDGYNRGLNLSAALDINYIIKKYLKGYL
jgi:hypothetical protein